MIKNFFFILILVFWFHQETFSNVEKEQILKKSEIVHFVQSKGYKNIEKFYFFNDDSSKILSIDSCIDMISIEQDTRYTVLFVTKGKISVNRKIPNECKFIVIAGTKILSSQQYFLPDSVSNLYCNNELFDDLLLDNRSDIKNFSNNINFIVHYLCKPYLFQNDSNKYMEDWNYVRKFKQDYLTEELSLEKYTKLHSIPRLEFKLDNCSTLVLPTVKNLDLQVKTHRLMLVLNGKPIETLTVKNLSPNISLFKLENSNTSMVTFDNTPQFKILGFENKLDTLLTFNYDNLLSLKTLRHILLAGFKINKETIPFDKITNELNVFKLYANLKEANSEEEYYDFKKLMKEFNEKNPEILTDVSKNYRYWTTIGF